MPQTSFTLGIEEEFQIVNRQTGQLSSSIELLLEKGGPLLGEQIKAELVQSAIELVSPVCPDIANARQVLLQQRSCLAQIAQAEDLALISAGTHPVSSWLDQEITARDRYLQLLEEQQDAIRAQVIFGLHVHVGVSDRERAVRLMNQVRTWLPHLLALSANSPFWLGRFTGMKSYRSLLWQGGPRSGIPGVLSSRDDLNHFMSDLIAVDYISGSGDIWWDVRLNSTFNTIEFRICDMPATVEDSIALTALCQALIAKLTWLDEHHMSMQVLPRDYIMENKWQAIRYGLDAQIADFVQLRRVPMRAAIHELLDFVQDVVDTLGSQREMAYLRALLDSPTGTGADQQIAVYQQTGDVQSVVTHLAQQTMQGISTTSVF